MSLFGVVFLSIWGALIKGGYPYVGEWYQKEGDETLAQQQSAASAAVFRTVGIYAGFFAISFLGIIYNYSKVRFSCGFRRYHFFVVGAFLVNGRYVIQYNNEHLIAPSCVTCDWYCSNKTHPALTILSLAPFSFSTGEEAYGVA